MKIGRLFNQIYAYIFGYFWLLCPICKEKFGGHEWGRCSNGMPASVNGIGVCYKKSCIKEGEKDREKMMKEISEYFQKSIIKGNQEAL